MMNDECRGSPAPSFIIPHSSFPSLIRSERRDGLALCDPVAGAYAYDRDDPGRGRVGGDELLARRGGRRDHWAGRAARLPRHDEARLRVARGRLRALEALLRV